MSAMLYGAVAVELRPASRLSKITTWNDRRQRRHLRDCPQRGVVADAHDQDERRSLAVDFEVELLPVGADRSGSCFFMGASHRGGVTNGVPLGRSVVTITLRSRVTAGRKSKG